MRDSFCGALGKLQRNGNLPSERILIIALVENLNGHGQVFTLELLLVDETARVSDLRSAFVYPYCVRVETESELTMSGAQKISSRSRSLTASDTKALLLRAEALLALEKGVGKRRNGIF